MSGTAVGSSSRKSGRAERTFWTSGVASDERRREGLVDHELEAELVEAALAHRLG